MANAQNPVVSVIVPARNEEACLALCLESLVSQTGIDFEVIVVDDASTDRTAEIARSYAASHVGAVIQNSHLARFSPDGTEACPGGSGKGTSSTGADRNLASDNDGTAGSRAVPVRGEYSISRNCLDVILICAPPLPENWTGKNNAMSAGAKIAKGKWLLFTDADTVHKPGSLVRAVGEAEEHGAALLSYSPEQEVRTFWEKAVMPVIFAELAATYPPNKVNDPSSQIAAANGQYLLISREAYDAVGGHTKIASDLLEDVAMAGLVKSSGRKIFFRYGGDAVRTRMYRSWAQLKEGWTKNLVLLFPKPTELAQLRLWQFIFLLTAPWSIARGTYWRNPAVPSSIPLIRWQYLIFGLLIHLLFVWWAAAFVIRMRRSHSSWQGITLGFFGLPVFAYLLWRSHRAYKQARFDWKDRSYVYSEDEIKHMTHGFDPEYAKWPRIWVWIRNRGRA